MNPPPRTPHTFPGGWLTLQADPNIAFKTTPTPNGVRLYLFHQKYNLAEERACSSELNAPIRAMQWRMALASQGYV